MRHGRRESPVLQVVDLPPFSASFGEFTAMTLTPPEPVKLAARSGRGNVLVECRNGAR